LKPVCWSHCVATWRRSAPIVELTQVAFVPEPSLSRYWCISIAMWLFGSLRFANAAAFPEDTHVHAPV
jgi:hypothetical protein